MWKYKNIKSSMPGFLFIDRRQQRLSLFFAVYPLPIFVIDVAQFDHLVCVQHEGIHFELSQFLFRQQPIGSVSSFNACRISTPGVIVWTYPAHALLLGSIFDCMHCFFASWSKKISLEASFKMEYDDILSKTRPSSIRRATTCKWPFSGIECWVVIFNLSLFD